MFKRILVTLFFLASTSVFAGNMDSRSIASAGWDKLTESQQAEILKQVADTATTTAAKVTEVSTVAKVDEYVQLGERIGKMMGGAAKEVGVQVNEFVKTPVGKWTMAIVIWKYMGAVIIHLFGGVLVLITGLGLIVIVYKRLSTTTIIYDSTKTDIFGRAVKNKVVRESLTGDDIIYLTFFTIITILLFLVTVFTY